MSRSLLRTAYTAFLFNRGSLYLQLYANPYHSFSCYNCSLRFIMNNFFYLPQAHHLRTDTTAFKPLIGISHASSHHNSVILCSQLRCSSNELLYIAAATSRHCFACGASPHFLPSFIHFGTGLPSLPALP